MTSRPQNARRSGPAYAFGKFTITPEGFLLREGAEVLLRPKAFDVLLYLVERHGHVVTKQELLGALWNDAAVTDNSLAQCLVEIRRALDDHSQQVIRTIARRGYLFAAPVSYPLEEARRSIASPPAIEPIEPRTSSWRLRWNRRGAGIAAAVVAALAFFALRPSPPLQSEAYTQITSYTDSAVAPALSLDGRMLAFIRSSTAFLTPDQIYVKLLPDGEAVQLTQDPRPKYGPAFSPDGLQIAYTAADGAGWHTYTISALGGESHLLMDNAAGLSWLDEKHVLFSQIRAGLHMGIVAGTRDRREIREVYFPPHERSMAHYSYPSPDRKWAIVVEMDSRPAWQPCRLIPLDGSTPGALAGPNGPCTSAAWSPDGRWMYFAVDVKGARHLWRQRFPHGVPEPITSGPAEEDGVAVMPDGRSLITSIGMRQSALWLHDTTGDRALTTEGSVMSSLGSYSSPSFSADGKSLYYVLKRSPTAQAELWVADIDSGGHQPVLTAMPVIEYDVSNNGTEVVFSTENSKGLTELWRAPVDRSREPSPLGAGGKLTTLRIG